MRRAQRSPRLLFSGTPLQRSGNHVRTQAMSGFNVNGATSATCRPTSAAICGAIWDVSALAQRRSPVRRCRCTQAWRAGVCRPVFPGCDRDARIDSAHIQIVSRRDEPLRTPGDGNHKSTGRPPSARGSHQERVDRLAAPRSWNVRIAMRDKTTALLVIEQHHLCPIRTIAVREISRFEPQAGEVLARRGMRRI
jgi:hypothetical protein